MFLAISFGESNEESGDDGTLPTYVIAGLAFCVNFSLIVFSFLTLPLCYFYLWTMLSHLDAANSSVMLKLYSSYQMTDC